MQYLDDESLDIPVTRIMHDMVGEKGVISVASASMSMAMALAHQGHAVIMLAVQQTIIAYLLFEKRLNPDSYDLNRKALWTLIDESEAIIDNLSSRISDDDLKMMGFTIKEDLGTMLDKLGIDLPKNGK